MLSGRLILTFSVLSALTVALAPAQTTRPAERHTVGVVTGADVYVRSGPGLNFYPCMKLSYPARVRAVAHREGWLMIIPPAGCFSLISKDYVRAEGVVGTVRGANVQVRAGSGLATYRGRTGVVQKRFNTGEKVTIVGEQAGYYRIVPPPGVYLWISAKYVKAVGAGTQPVGTLASQPATTQPVIVTTTHPDVIKNELAAFEAVEKALVAEFQKPREKRNIPTLLAQYKAIKLSPDSPLAPYVRSRIRFLQSEVRLTGSLREAELLVREAEAKQARLAADRQRFRSALPTTRPVRVYAAEGILAASELFTGGPTAPKRYLVRDPDTHLISAYVQCTTGAVNLAEHVGAQVGVIGMSHYDEVIRLYVIEAERIVMLRAAPRPIPKTKPVTRLAPAPKPEPTTRPAPEPEPTIKPVIVPTTKPATEPEPTTQPAPKPAPTTRPATEPEPTTQAHEDKPLPSTGLPMVETTTGPAVGTGINRREYE